MSTDQTKRPAEPKRSKSITVAPQLGRGQLTASYVHRLEKLGASAAEIRDLRERAARPER